MDITVDYLWDWRHLTDLLRYLDITQGVVPFFPKHFIKATQRDITENGAKKEIIRLNKVLPLISTYISVCTLFKYKHADSRKAANVLIADSVSDPKKKLEELLEVEIKSVEKVSE